uniref:Uncharacterized protein n=1 Tax=Leptocylindrus danicus TaxID=163516 RepID=A0A7S2JXM5_9STRA|mmetsp:Transcript_1235/g.1782  ORF Transcript_1235/g.1782 Transcript_1235/m.1782 type:complete len:296 (+) Transcript_1235:94-981(+)
MFIGKPKKLTYENDNYVRRAKDLLCCSAEDIERFWVIFKKLVDDSEGGTISLNKFYTKFLRINRSILGDTIFEIVDCSRDPHRITFGQFILGISSFILCQVEGIVKLIFYNYDRKEKRGYVYLEDLRSFLETSHGKMNEKLTAALRSYPPGCKINYGEVCALATTHKILLWPVLHLQNLMRLQILGCSWWTKRTRIVANVSTSAETKLEHNRAIEEKRLHQEWQEDIKEDLGMLEYMRGGSKRRYLERVNPKPIVYINDKNEIRIEYPAGRKLPGDEDIEQLIRSKKSGNSCCIQ